MSDGVLLAAELARVEVASGARAGLVIPLAGEVVTVGRGAECQLRMDPDRDLDVSGRHAAFLQRPDGWHLVDVGSRNGTFLNDAPVTGEVALTDGDRIALGAAGPVLRFHAKDASLASPPPAPPPPPAPAARSGLPVLPLATLVSIVVLGAGAFLFVDRREQRAWERERATLQLRLDSLRLESERAEASLKGEVGGLAQALHGSREQVTRLQGELAQAAGGHAARGGIAQRLEEASTRLRGQQAAAALDFGAIQRANRRATARLYVEFEDGSVATATAFVVEPDGLLLTNRHAVLGGDTPRRPKRLALQFTDSDQIFPARLLATLDSADLAAVRVESLDGQVPVVRGLNLRPDTLPAGAPVAVLGFPLGGDEPVTVAGGKRPLARPLLGAGTLRSVAGDRLELNGYGAEGSSGSPIFDGAGEVVGVLFGGRQEAAGQVLYAVPASTAARLLAAVRRSAGS